MSVQRVARELYSRLFPGLRGPEEERVTSEDAAASEEPRTTDEAESPAEEADEFGEFSDFLQDVGAENCAPDPDRLKDLTIESLREQLRDLQRLGDELAQTEQARLAGLERIAELEAENESLREAPRSSECTDNSAHAKELAKRDRAEARLKERLDRMRTKFEERKRVAGERWRELQSLKRELREAKARTNSTDSKSDE